MTRFRGEPRHALEGKKEELERLRAKHRAALGRLWSEATEEALRRLEADEDLRMPPWKVPPDLVTDEFYRLVRRLGTAQELSGLALSWGAA